MSELEATNAELEDANTQLEGMALAAGAQRDEARSALAEAQDAVSKVQALETEHVRECEAVREREHNLRAQVAQLQAAQASLKVSHSLSWLLLPTSIAGCSRASACIVPARASSTAAVLHK